VKIKIILKSIAREQSYDTGNHPEPRIFQLFWESLSMEIEVGRFCGHFGTYRCISQ